MASRLPCRRTQAHFSHRPQLRPRGRGSHRIAASSTTTCGGTRSTSRAAWRAQGLPGRIQITRATCELIKDEFACEARGKVEVKGVGEVETSLVGERVEVAERLCQSLRCDILPSSIKDIAIRKP